MVPYLPPQICADTTSGNLRNGGFGELQVVSGGGTPPPRWAIVSTSGGSEQIPSGDRTGDSKSGVWQASYTAPGQVEAISQVAEGLDNGIYEVSGYIKRIFAIVPDSLESSVTISEHGGSDITFTVSPSMAEIWEFFSQQVTVSSGKLKVTLRSMSGNNSGPPDRWDDIRVCAVSLAAPTPAEGPSLLSSKGGRTNRHGLLPEGVNLIAAPNPASDRSIVWYRLDESASVRIMVANTVGEVVLARELGNKARGEHSEQLDLQGLASGLYFVVVQSNQNYGYRNVGMFKIAVVK